MNEEQMELRRLGQDIKLFLRMASSNFTAKHDLAVIVKLNELAERYAHGQDIMLVDRT